MKLWAVVEDYYEGHPHEDNSEYENNLCCLYETKEEAEKHISDGIATEEDETHTYGFCEVYELVQEKEDRLVYEDTLVHEITKVRRIVPIETGVFREDPRNYGLLDWNDWYNKRRGSMRDYYDWVNYDD